MTAPIDVTEELFDAVGVPFVVFTVTHLVRSQLDDASVGVTDLAPLKDWPAEIRDRYIEALRSDLSEIGDWVDNLTAVLGEATS